MQQGEQKLPLCPEGNWSRHGCCMSMQLLCINATKNPPQLPSLKSSNVHVHVHLHLHLHLHVHLALCLVAARQSERRV